MEYILNIGYLYAGLEACFLIKLNIFLLQITYMIKELKQNQISLEEKGPSYEIMSLTKEVNRAISDNRKIYKQIRQLDPNFYHKLYEPIKHQGIDQMFLKPLILRQIDQLMEEKQDLVKKKQMLIFMNSQRTPDKDMLDVNSKHYAFLRTTWTKIQSKDGDASEKIDNLNKIIGMVRANIKNLTENDQRGINKQIIFENPQKSYTQLIAQEKQREELGRLRMRNEELEMRCVELGQIIESKNNKIQVLQYQLGLVQNRIRESIETLHLTGDKLLSLKKSKDNLQAEVKRLQISENQNHFVLFTGPGEDFKVKIKWNDLKQTIFEETTKSVGEIIDFLKGKFDMKPITTFECINPELQIPSLNLNWTSSTNETTVTDRYIPKPTKFIPMRTQRSSVMKSKTLKQSLDSNKNENEVLEANMDISEISIKRFSRKGEFPLTSDRFRRESRSKISSNEYQDIQSQILQKKLQMR